MYDRHQRLKLPVVHISSPFHLVFHEVRELCWIIPRVYHILHEELLLHCSKLLISVLVLIKGAAVLDHTLRVRIEHVLRATTI